MINFRSCLFRFKQKQLDDFEVSVPQQINGEEGSRLTNKSITAR